ncbi:FYN-binding protein 1 isoform X1 [Hippoglossus stenolepis]|uniref:FYN-binding protein 1 isoform X1 n=1 Tax=Hippoglossus stenolepis TaxID=195615 RepID=UPI001FAF9D7F|nr:FYN-binding protein 1 isoform X1 [Hippoglossus stenolepis]
MANKSDVKAMKARFEVSESSNDDTSPAGRTKQPLGPTLSSGSTTLTKKPLGRESFSGSAIIIPPKPAFLKNAVSPRNDTVVHEPNKTIAPTSRFANTQDDLNARIKPFIGNKQQIPMKPHLSKPPEAKAPIQKTPLNKPPLSSTLSDAKPKPPPTLTSKPSWVKHNTGGVPSTASSALKIPPLQQKTSSSLIKLWQQNEDKAGANMDTADKPSPQTKPPSNFRASQNVSNKEKDNSEQPENGGTSKAPGSAANSVPPAKPPAAKKPSLKRYTKDSPQLGTDNGVAIGPKRNPLPNSLALGTAPAKPNRPPKVNLENFKRGAVASEDGPGTLAKSIIPAPLPSNHRNHVIPPPAAQADFPSLPPRHPGSMIEQEEIYDDLDEVNSNPPPLPLPSGHPSQWAKEGLEDDDDGDTYDDLDERWEEVEQKQEKQKEKEAKEVKKRQEAEKKEQKEREKKEQDARKKFKLVGPLEVIQQGKACVDCKGNKTDLLLKLGDSLDILRVQGNPEGKWLGRTQDGSIGYVKTVSVEIDFNSLKNRSSQQESDPEVYDDIDVLSADNSGIKGPGVVLPPLPGEEGEIYDDVSDPNLEGSPVDSRASFVKSRSFLRMFERNNRLASTKVVPPPSQFAAQGNSDQAEDEEIYDDVDSQNQPPPLPSFPNLKGRSRNEEMDPKKQKKFEKEEKEFRKKFKYDGEIQVLHQVTIVHTLTNKRWNGKELPVKAAEQLDVIVEAVDNKLICRNEEGKFGYVSTGHIVTDDADIYDDIRDDCVYDND